MKKLENLIGNPEIKDFGRKGSIRLPKYERIESIRQALESGLSSKEEIAEKIGLSPMAVYQYAREAGIRLPNKSRYGKRLEHTEEIKKAFDEGLSLKLAAKKVGLHPGTVYMYARSAGIPITTKKVISPQEYIESIKSAFEEGCKTINGLAKKLGHNPGTIQKYAKMAGVEFPSKTHRKRSNLIDELIENGLPTTEIGKIIGVSRQAVDSYICSSGQHERWKKYRSFRTEKEIDNLEEEKKQRLELLCLLDERITQLAEKEGWSSQMALSYIRNAKPNQSIPFETLAELFTRYETAKNNNERVSLKKLAEGLSLSYGTAGRIIKKMGLEPLCWRVEDKHILSSAKRKAIKKAFNIRMPATDLAYFLGISPFNLEQRFLKVGKKRPTIKNHMQGIRRFGYGKLGRALTYRLASQVYGAQDCDFKPEEIQELLDTTQEVVDYALGRRKSIEPRIVRALRILYDNPMISKPYHSKLENR